MLDEIDAIAGARTGSSSGSTKELNNTTITLLQELDQLSNRNIVIAATNIPDVVDHAVMRRFTTKHCIFTPGDHDIRAIIEKYQQSLPGIRIEFTNDEVTALHNQSQSEVVKEIIKKIIEQVKGHA